MKACELLRAIREIQSALKSAKVRDAIKEARATNRASERERNTLAKRKENIKHQTSVWHRKPRLFAFTIMSRRSSAFTPDIDKTIPLPIIASRGIYHECSTICIYKCRKMLKRVPVCNSKVGNQTLIPFLTYRWRTSILGWRTCWYIRGTLRMTHNFDQSMHEKGEKEGCIER